jgi:tetratricopeptide (TPR) repeat protein
MRKRRATLLVDAGIWLRLAGDEDGARKLFEQALALDPENVQAGQLLRSSKGADDGDDEGVSAGKAAATAAPAQSPARVERPRRESPPPAAPAFGALPRTEGRPPPRVMGGVRSEQSRLQAEAERRVRSEAEASPAALPEAPRTELELLRAVVRGPAGLAEPEAEHPGFDADRAGLIQDEARPTDGTVPWTPGRHPPPSSAPRAARKAPPATSGRAALPSRPPVADAASDEPSPTGDGASIVDATTVFMNVGEGGLLPGPAPVLSRRDAIVEYLRETDAYLRFGIYEKALEFAAKVLAEDPDNDEAHQKAKEALVASKGSAAAFEQLLKVLRVYASRLDAERAGPFLDELMTQQPSHPELPVFLSVLRPYELDSPGDGGATGEGLGLLDLALQSYLEGTLHPELAVDPLETLPPDATVPSGLRLPAMLRLGVSAAPVQGGSPQETLPPGVRLSADLGPLAVDGDGVPGNSNGERELPRVSAARPESSREWQPAPDVTVLSPGRELAPPPPPPVSAPEMTKTVFEDEEAEAPQPPFRRPKKRR